MVMSYSYVTVYQRVKTVVYSSQHMSSSMNRKEVADILGRSGIDKLTVALCAWLRIARGTRGTRGTVNGCEIRSSW